MPSFVDRVVIHAIGGGGGNGCASIRREKFKPLAGPDGGKGGNGGSVIAKVDPQVTTLLTYHHSPHIKATNGAAGAGDYRDGANGEDRYVAVPAGTVIKTRDGEILADLTREGEEYVIAQGGQGGLGNFGLASKRRKAPGFALLGEPGQERDVVLELKSMADVALVGYPSSGKSSLIGAMSAARPKIADYPFTTLVPNLGVVEAGDYRFTMADVPGLIPGASQGKGLGLDFLRHIERCSVIAHVVDCAAFEAEREPLADIKMIEAELQAYADDLNAEVSRVDGASGALSGTSASLPPLMERQRIIILNKIDVPDGRDMAEFSEQAVKEFGWPVFMASAVSREGLPALAFALGQMVEEFRQQAPVVETRPVIKPQARRGKPAPPFSITVLEGPEGPTYQVRGEKVERWVRQTDFTNDEAVGFLADRLNGIGVEEALANAGAVPGDPILIGEEEGGVVFDWDPSLQAGAELLGARGTDNRLYEGGRRTNAERRVDYYAWMDAKAAARAELASEREAGIWTDPDSED